MGIDVFILPGRSVSHFGYRFLEESASTTISTKLISLSSKTNDLIKIRRPKTVNQAIISYMDEGMIPVRGDVAEDTMKADCLRITPHKPL